MQQNASLARGYYSLDTARPQKILLDLHRHEVKVQRLAVDDTVIVMTLPCLSLLKHLIQVQGGAIK